MIKYLHVAMLLLIALTGCQQQKAPNTIPQQQYPQRIISAAPLITEVMFALGMQHRLVGRTDYCTYPAQVSEIASIGSLRDPSIETVLSLKPDLVITSTHFRDEVAQKMAALGMNVKRVLNQQNLNGAYQTIRETANLVGCPARADSLIEQMEEQRLALVEKVKVYNKHPTVYYVIGYGKMGDYTAGGDTFINAMITMAGGKNVASDLEGWNYNLESLMAQNPDIVLVRNDWKEAFMTTAPYNQLKAVKNNAVYEIDNRLFELNGPRIMDGLAVMVDIFGKH